MLPEFRPDMEFAHALDEADELKIFRERFSIPSINGKEAVYLCGNSLGLQPKSVAGYIKTELEDWASLGVEGHLHARNPWIAYHKLLSAPLAEICGAKTEEVVAMNSLSVNLHLLLVSFYRPQGKKIKILTEDKMFPSDIYALKSQIRHQGYDVDETLVFVKPGEGKSIIDNNDILRAIEAHAGELALVFFSGVHFHNGQVFDIASIVKAAHAVGAVAGFDLAHAIGNIPLSLHDWDVDFAVWCSYKYLNSGPGGVGGAFVHQRFSNFDGNRFEGWWGHREEDRFQMKDTFTPALGVEAWQLSNAPVISMAVQRASLEIFADAGMKRLREKSEKLTAYLEYLIKQCNNKDAIYKVSIITPSNPDSRGCQISLRVDRNCESLYKLLLDNGIVIDMRRPDVIRIAPVPLYNSFEDVYKVGLFLKQYCNYE